MNVNDFEKEHENGFIFYKDWSPEVLEISGVECCGWLLVHDFPYGYGTNVKKVKEELRILSEGNCLFECEEETYTNFTLYCVLMQHQSKLYEETLMKLGWHKMPSFKNPNTGNTCTPYMLVPKELKK